MLWICMPNQKSFFPTLNDVLTKPSPIIFYIVKHLRIFRTSINEDVYTVRVHNTHKIVYKPTISVFNAGYVDIPFIIFLFTCSCCLYCILLFFLHFLHD